jgi:hypothetical protein
MRQRAMELERTIEGMRTGKPVKVRPLPLSALFGSAAAAPLCTVWLCACCVRCTACAACSLASLPVPPELPALPPANHSHAPMLH